ncbi:MAG: helical backbone metal receptor [Bacteroidota bacterium]
MNIIRLIITGLLITVYFNSISQTPRRIVSLVPSITKQLYELGVEDKIVGCTNYCPGKDIKSVTVVASAIKVNIEKTLLLKPDLVLASALTSPKTLETFKKLGVKTIWFDYPKSFEDLCKQFLDLGKIVGKQNHSIKMVNRAKVRLSTIRNKIPQNNPLKMFVQIGANPLFAAIENTFMDDYIKFSGGTNIIKGLKSGAVSRESILLKNPEVIFVITMGVVGKQEKELWKSYKSLNAAKSKRIFIIDADIASSPTPKTFVDVVEIMVELIYD